MSGALAGLTPGTAGWSPDYARDYGLGGYGIALLNQNLWINNYTTTTSNTSNPVMTQQMMLDAIQQVRARERANDLRAAVLAGHYSAQQFARDKATNTRRKKLLLCAV